MQGATGPPGGSNDEMGTSKAEATEVKDRPVVFVTSEHELGGGAAATFETTDARGYAPALEALASALHGDRSAQARADRGGEGAAALSGGESGGPEDGGGTRRPLGRQTHEPQREGDLADNEARGLESDAYQRGHASRGNQHTAEQNHKRPAPNATTLDEDAGRGGTC